MPLFRSITNLARSPQGRRAINKAVDYARTPEGRRRVSAVRERLAARGGRRTPPR